MNFKAEWALPFCLAAWLVTLHAGASDPATQRRNFELLHTATPALSSPTSRLDPDQDRQQFLMNGILVDVRTSVINGHGLRRRLYHGSAKNTGDRPVPGAVLELLEAPVSGRRPDGTVIAGVFEVVASQLLGDLAAGQSRVVALTLERPDVSLRVYQLRLRGQ